MTPAHITQLIKGRQAEYDSVKASHDAMWKKSSAELAALKEKHQAVNQEMQSKGVENELKLQRLAAQIEQLKELLPKKSKPPKK